MENKEQTTQAAANCCKNNDCRTFVIALLTSIVVVAVYHFAVGLVSICNGTYEKDNMPPVCGEYVLVPVRALPEGPCPAMRGPGKFRRGSGFHHKNFRKGPGMFPQDCRKMRGPEGFECPGKGPGMKDCPRMKDCPKMCKPGKEQPKPAPVEPAPAKPAPEKPVPPAAVK